MRLPWFACGLALALCGTVGAETIISGNVLSDTTWGPSGTPYIVTGDVRVRFEATLTIEGGTEVRFEPGGSLTTDAGSAIVAAGTSGSRIAFRSSTASPAVGDWDGISVYASAGSSFARCDFLHADACLEMNVSDGDVDRCTFTESVVGIRCLRSSPTITGCSFTGLTSVGVLCWGRESRPGISGSNFTDNPWNIYLSSYTSPLVTIVAEDNWWGTASEPEIAAGIYDNDDSPAVYGVVDYDPWLKGEAVRATTWGALKALFR
ncbi:MAG: hypothetical protein GF405_02930 [Candidatus Eisenbacteria bacterium]|nr:hypothetical protein [Candidatus Eisenbacteria bacterium]